MWWCDYNKRHPNTIPTTWDHRKAAMRHDLLKMQCFQQGFQSVVDYYQALEKYMIRCGLLEQHNVAVAYFRGFLNREIQDILDCK
jgi:hypothetical protein